MVKLYIYKLFYLLQNPSSNLKKLSSLIMNDNILKEISLQNKYKNKIRKTFGYNIENEKYKIEKISIDKEKSTFRIKISAIHSFNYINSTLKTKSSERLYFILILKKVNKLWTILDMCNKDVFPSTYDKLSKKTLFYNIKECLDLDYRLKFLENQLSSLNSFLIDYKRMVRTSNSPLPFRGSNYNSKLASEYAQKYALNYNTKYKSFDNSGGDCTNFVSQCLHAGNIPITNSWRPYSTSWIRVNELYHYLIKNAIGVNITSKPPYKEGDVIQFYANSKGYFSHSGVITKSLGYGEYLYCCHSYDKLNFPLSEIFPFMYDKIRVIQPK